MQIEKRDGSIVPIDFNAVKERLELLNKRLGVLDIDLDMLCVKVISSLTEGIKTSEVDEITSRICGSLTILDPDYSVMGGAVLHSDLLKQNNYEGEDLLGTYNLFAMVTLKKSYLRFYDGIQECPEMMLTRVAKHLHPNDELSQKETYRLMSNKYYSPASPVYMNSGTKVNQLASCFLLSMADSIDGIFECISDSAKLSKNTGGLGVSLDLVRGKGSLIKTTGGKSGGIVPWIRTINNAIDATNQGGLRNGSCAIYLSPHHKDVEDFLELKLPVGEHKKRAHDLFYALWIPDLFFEKVKNDDDWYLFCPNEAPQLNETFGADYEIAYCKYIDKGMYTKKVKARDIWKKIIKSQAEAGMPYLLAKDTINRSNMQKNIGVIRSSNLCAEVVLATNPDSTGVCNLSNINLGAFVKDRDTFDFNGLKATVQQVVRNINKAIDKNKYPTKKAEENDKRARPLGIGVQGLADVFHKMHIPFDSHKAKVANRRIFETLYYEAVYESAMLCKNKEYERYPAFKDSPYSEGKLHPDLLDTYFDHYSIDAVEDLRAKVQVHGVANSLFIALAPTASTSNILGGSEAFYPVTSNLYVRKVMSGEIIQINKHLIKDLKNQGLWNDENRTKLIEDKGSVKNLPISDHLKNVYKTVYEIPQKVLIDLEAGRQAFVDQSMSANRWVNDPTYPKLTSMYFYAWEKKCKTISYYTHSQAASDASDFGLAKDIQCYGCQ